MLLIWTSGLSPETQLTKELHEALTTIGKKTVAGTNSLATRSAVITLYIYFFLTRIYFYCRRIDTQAVGAGLRRPNKNGKATMSQMYDHVNVLRVNSF